MKIEKKDKTDINSKEGKEVKTELPYPKKRRNKRSNAILIDLARIESF